MREQGESIVLVADRYRILGRLGGGGMGRVYVAHDTLLERTVALKVLREDLARGEEFVRRFRREAQAAASLSHENVVRVFDTGTDDGVPYIAMEYVAGGTVDERLKREGALPSGEAARIAVGIALALGAAHEGGIVHRDVKPHNVFLTEGGDVKVGDFGIALAAGAPVLTQASLILGTARYISPEAAEGEPATPRSDLYSLGVVLYEMLTGRPPFEAENPVALAMRHVTEEAVPPRSLMPSVPKALDAATMRLLAKDPADRPASAFAAADEIEGAGDPTRPEVLRPAVGTPVRAPGAARVRPGRSRGRTLLAAVLCALLAAVALPTALPALVQPGEGGPLRRVLSSFGDAGSGAGGSGAVQRLASPLGGPAPAAPEPPEAAPRDASPPPAGGEGETRWASSEQYRYAPQYAPDEGPQYAPLPTPAGPEAQPAPPAEPELPRAPQAGRDEAPEPTPPKPTSPEAASPKPASPGPASPSPAPQPAPDPGTEKASPSPPRPDPVAPENTPPPLGPDEGTEGLTEPEPSVGTAPQDEADEIIETVQERVEERVEGIAPGFSFDDGEDPREERGGNGSSSSPREGTLED